jgi:centriolar protein POC1
MSSDDPTLERHFRGHRDTVTAVAFNPTLKQLASSSLDSSIMVWNLKQKIRAFRCVNALGLLLITCYV